MGEIMADEKDKLGMAKEWEETAPPAQQNPPADEKKTFSREIDVGGRIQKFEAETYEALVDKLVEAQTNATKKLQELAQARRAKEPEKISSDWQEVKPGMATGDPAMVDQFRKMFEAQLGMSPDIFRERENQRRRQEAESTARVDFVRKHTEYNDSVDNANKIMNFLNEQNLPISRRNLDYAYEELRGELAARPAAPQPQLTTPVNAEPKAPQPPPRVEARSTPPTAIRPSLGGRGPIEEGGGQDAEIARIAQSSSLPEMKSRIEAYFRQLRTSAR